MVKDMQKLTGGGGLVGEPLPRTMASSEGMASLAKGELSITTGRDRNRVTGVGWGSDDCVVSSPNSHPRILSPKVKLPRGGSQEMTRSGGWGSRQ